MTTYNPKQSHITKDNGRQFSTNDMSLDISDAAIQRIVRFFELENLPTEVIEQEQILLQKYLQKTMIRMTRKSDAV